MPVRSGALRLGGSADARWPLPPADTPSRVLVDLLPRLGVLPAPEPILYAIVCCHCLCEICGDPACIGSRRELERLRAALTAPQWALVQKLQATMRDVMLARDEGREP